MITEASDGPEPAWRMDYFGRMHETLLARGGDRAGAESNVRQSLQRDYPISTRELTDLLREVGFAVDVHRYEDRDEPLGPCVAT